MSRAGRTAVLAALLAASPARAASAQAATPATPATPATLATLATNDRPRRASDAPITETFGALSVTAIGMSPMVSSGVALAVGARWRDVSLSIEPRLLFGMEPMVVSAQQVTSRLDAAALRGCRHSRELLLCGTVQVGTLALRRALATGVLTSSLLCTIGIVGGTELRLTDHVALRGLFEVHTWIGQPSLWLSARPVWSPFPLASVVGLGFVLGSGAD